MNHIRLRTDAVLDRQIQAADSYFKNVSRFTITTNTYLENCTCTDTSAQTGAFLPVVILFIFGSCAVGALSRMMVRTLRQVPYTVVLLIFGILLGALADKVDAVRKYTSSMTNMDPHIIMYLFLPVLTFDSGYAMEVHTFFKSFWQVVMLAGIGTLLTTAMTAYFCVYMFSGYHWSTTVGLLFGALISATDSVAVLAVLRHLNASKQLTILLEGESMLNDGAAIVLFSIFEHLATTGESSNFTAFNAISLIVLKIFVGPLFGYFVGQLTVVWMLHVFNDALTEITITLSVTYISFFISEFFMQSSGVLTVVVLGITLANNRSCVSPEVGMFLRRFWEMLAYLSETLIFILVGTLIMKHAYHYLTWRDAVLNLALYLAIFVFRSVMLLVLSPIITRLGYGLTVKNAILLTWGGVRGAVGLALALIVYQNHAIDSTGQIQQKILLHTAGVVLLTLLINASTIKPLLQTLGMNEVPLPRRSAMASAVRNLHHLAKLTTSLYKTDRFLFDADWETVGKYTAIRDPYQTTDEEAELNHLTTFEKNNVCPECHGLVPNKPSPKEFKEMQEEARLRILKAELVSYWKQFGHGMLTHEALRKLSDLVDTATDHPPELTDVHAIVKSWKIRSYFSIVKGKLLKWQHSRSADREIPPPKGQFALMMYKICNSIAFDVIVYVLILVNSTIIILEINEEFKLCKAAIYNKYGYAFDYINYAFVGIFVTEAAIKMIGLRMYYFQSKWNIFDFVVLSMMFIDICLDLTVFKNIDTTTCVAASTKAFSPSVFRTAKAFRFFRLVRSFRLVRALLPKVLKYLDILINHKLRIGYEVGQGYIVAEEEVLLYLDHLIDNPTISEEFRTVISDNRLEVIRGLGLLQKIHPGVAVSIKTKQAARRILNALRDRTRELKCEGVLFEIEADKLELIIENQVKQLEKIPPSIRPAGESAMLRNLNWVKDDEALVEFIVKNAEEIILYEGDMLDIGRGNIDGLYIVITGMLKTNDRDSDTATDKGKDTHTYGLNTTSEHCVGCDYLTGGAVIGELSLLTGTSLKGTIVAETSTQLYHLSIDVMQKAFEEFVADPSLEYRLWKSCALRIAVTILHVQPQYVSWSTEKINVLLEKGVVILKKHCLHLVHEDNFPSFHIDTAKVVDFVLIHGSFQDAVSLSIWEGPTYIPASVTNLTFLPGQTNKHVFLVTLRHDETFFFDLNSNSNFKGQLSSLCLQHASQHRQILNQKISDIKVASEESIRRRISKHWSKLTSRQPRPGDGWSFDTVPEPAEEDGLTHVQSDAARTNKQNQHREWSFHKFKDDDQKQVQLEGTSPVLHSGFTVNGVPTSALVDTGAHGQEIHTTQPVQYNQTDLYPDQSLPGQVGVADQQTEDKNEDDGNDGVALAQTHGTSAYPKASVGAVTGNKPTQSHIDITPPGVIADTQEPTKRVHTSSEYSKIASRTGETSHDQSHEVHVTDSGVVNTNQIDVPPVSPSKAESSRRHQVHTPRDRLPLDEVGQTTSHTAAPDNAPGTSVQTSSSSGRILDRPARHTHREQSVVIQQTSASWEQLPSLNASDSNDDGQNL